MAAISFTKQNKHAFEMGRKTERLWWEKEIFRQQKINNELANKEGADTPAYFALKNYNHGLSFLLEKNKERLKQKSE